VSRELTEKHGTAPDDELFKHSYGREDYEISLGYQMLLGDEVVVYDRDNPEVLNAYVMTEDVMRDLEDESGDPTEFMEKAEEKLENSGEVRKFSQRTKVTRVRDPETGLDIRDKSEGDGEETWLAAENPTDVEL
jgi:hypothetical protein